MTSITSRLGVNWCETTSRTGIHALGKHLGIGTAPVFAACEEGRFLDAATKLVSLVRAVSGTKKRRTPAFRRVETLRTDS